MVTIDQVQITISPYVDVMQKAVFAMNRAYD